MISCIDFRFRKETAEFMENELGLKTFDLAAFPGGSKPINESITDVDLAMQCLSVPCELHHIKKIVVINHEDCGAYGGSAKFNNDRQAEKEFHFAELRKAKKKIMEKCPNREVVLIYADLTADKQNIEFLAVPALTSD